MIFQRTKIPSDSSISKTLTLRPFFSHVFSLLSEAIGAKSRENRFPCSPGGWPGSLGGLKTSLLAISQRRFLIKQPNLLRLTHPSSWLMPGVHLVLPSPVTEVVAPQVFPSFCMGRCVVVHASIFERRGFSPTRIAKSGFQKLPTAHPGAALGRVRSDLFSE